MNKRSFYDSHREYQSIQLKPLLSILETTLDETIDKDIKTGQAFRKELIKLKKIVDEITLRLD